MNIDNVTVIIPAFNEEASIGEMVQSLFSRFPTAEIIVVNDGSTDETGVIAQKAGAKVINHSRNYGYGSSLRTGIEESNRDYVLFCDGDGQHSVDDVELLIKTCDEYDMVVGRRSRVSHVPFSRRAGKYIMKKFANFLAGQRIPDLNSGLRIMRREIITKYLHLMPRGFSFSTTSTFAFLKSNRNVKYVRITVKKRVGNSTVSQWKHGPQALMLMLRLTVLFEPLKVFMSVAALLFLLSLASLLIDVIVSGAAGIGDTTVMLCISTLLVFMFGLLCDQVSSLRREIHE